MKTVRRLMAMFCVLIMLATVIDGATYARGYNLSPVQKIVESTTEIETE